MGDWKRPVPKNGGPNPRAHWDQLHRLNAVPIRFSSQGAPQVDRRDRGLPPGSVSHWNAAATGNSGPNLTN